MVMAWQYVKSGKNLTLTAGILLFSAIARLSQADATELRLTQPLCYLPHTFQQATGRAPASLNGEATSSHFITALPGEKIYDEVGIKAKKSELESKGLEFYRNHTANFALNVGVHSMFVYSITQCMPLRKHMEFRLGFKYATPQHRPDGVDGLDVATGEGRADGTLSLNFAF
jgi:hypothetical protein